MRNAKVELMLQIQGSLSAHSTALIGCRKALFVLPSSPPPDNSTRNFELIHLPSLTLNSTMFGPFRASSPLLGGKLWKIPWRLSTPQKRRQRKRMSQLLALSSSYFSFHLYNILISPSHISGLRIIDTTISTVESSLAKAGYTSKPIVRWREEMPTEAEMVPKDKYTVFDRKEKKYRKSIRSMCIPI
ncbi:54S ribosomal protein L31 [Physcia stellaris]|nr:54S ribosomal protein L31 [Physcia stellaris]